MPENCDKFEKINSRSSSDTVSQADSMFIQIGQLIT